MLPFLKAICVKWSKHFSDGATVDLHMYSVAVLCLCRHELKVRSPIQGYFHFHHYHFRSHHKMINLFLSLFLIFGLIWAKFTT